VFSGNDFSDAAAIGALCIGITGREHNGFAPEAVDIFGHSDF
jgi:hypothetical protein